MPHQRLPEPTNPDLEGTDFQEWVQRLRSLRMKAREAIQRFVDGTPREFELEQMRREVCLILTDGLGGLLQDYWRDRFGPKENNCSNVLFFSPGYRPYGGDRAPLVPLPDAGPADQQLQRLGRHYPSPQNGFFALAAWMSRVYEEEYHSCRIGGFTDWFAQFDSVVLSGNEWQPLVAMALSVSEGDEESPKVTCANGVQRCILHGCSLPADQFLEIFERLLLTSFTWLDFRRRGRSTPLPLNCIIPYPPAKVRRGGQWIRVDLSTFELSPGDDCPLTPKELTPLTDEERVELQRAKLRFACLFQSIFGPVNVPGALAGDPLTIEILKILEHKTLVSYRHYYIFVTDLDLALDSSSQRSTVAHIGPRLGTLNLYTNRPIGDIALNLIRDSLESIYDTVRDAEILTLFARRKYHDDPVLRAWLDAYVDPWTDPRLVANGSRILMNPWEHTSIEQHVDMYADILRGILPGITDDSGMDRIEFMKQTFMTPYSQGIAERRDESDPRHPLDQRYCEIVWKGLELFGIVPLVMSFQSEYGFAAPCSPALIFFLSLRNLVWMMTLRDKPAPLAVELGHHFVLVRLNPSGLIDRNTLKGDLRLHEKTFKDKEGRGDLGKGLCGGIDLLRRCGVSDLPVASLVDDEFAMTFFRPSGRSLVVDWEDAAFRLSWNGHRS